MRKLFHGDNLHLLQAFIPADSVDLVYLDPPFNSRRAYDLVPETSAGRQPRAGVPAFDDTWHWDGEAEAALEALLAQPDRGVAGVITAFRTVLGPAGMAAYLVMMARRLLELRRVLSPSGSLYLHCDPSASHYLKVLLDTVFGAANFRNEIIWHYYNKYSAGKKIFPRCYDQIFFYSKGSSYTFHPQREAREKPVRQLVRQNVGGVLKNKKDAAGRTITRWVADRKVDSVWRIPCLQYASPEFLSFPTQKPTALLERVIQASSNPGDMVLDPYCGSGTTLHAAETLGRSWVGMDAAPLAIGVATGRLEQAFPGLVMQKIGAPAAFRIPAEGAGARPAVTPASPPRKTPAAKIPPSQQVLPLGPEPPATKAPPRKRRGSVVALEPKKPAKSTATGRRQETTAKKGAAKKVAAQRTAAGTSKPAARAR